MPNYKDLFKLWDDNANKDISSGLENFYKLEEDLANESIKGELN